MHDFYTHEIVPDDHVWFCDHVIYIISKIGEGFKTDFISLDPQYDEPMCLKDIAERFPDVVIVIVDGWMNGSIFRYQNHRNDPKAEDWERVGETLGFV